MHSALMCTAFSVLSSFPVSIVCSLHVLLDKEALINSASYEN